jgi:hypothetical protein
LVDLAQVYVDEETLTLEQLEDCVAGRARLRDRFYPRGRSLKLGDNVRREYEEARVRGWTTRGRYFDPWRLYCRLTGRAHASVESRSEWKRDRLHIDLDHTGMMLPASSVDRIDTFLRANSSKGDRITVSYSCVSAELRAGAHELIAPVLDMVLEEARKEERRDVRLHVSNRERWVLPKHDGSAWWEKDPGHHEGLAFHAALRAFDPNAVPVVTADLSVSPKRRAALLRQLLRRLGLRGVRVTSERFDDRVHVSLPHRGDDTGANARAREQFVPLLARAFPAHADGLPLTFSNLATYWEVI